MLSVGEVFPGNLLIAGKAEVKQLSIWLIELAGDDRAIRISPELRILLLVELGHGQIVEFTAVAPNTSVPEVVKALVYPIEPRTSPSV
jgi:hypothetical protein